MAHNWTNPTNFNKVEGFAAANRINGRQDYRAFTGMGMGGIQSNMRPFARSVAKGLGNIGRMSQPLSNQVNFFGRKATVGRLGLTGGLGLMAGVQAANTIDRMRYGDYGGAMLSGAMSAAAGYGAYSSWMYKGALRSHFNNAASWILKRFRA